MTYQRDLLDQADHLSQLDLKRPKQANLRRAISSAYYAVFHLLVDAGANEFVPAASKNLRSRIQRAFNHGEMDKVCAGFAGGTPQQPIIAMIGLPLERPLVSVAQAFLDLQEARHEADYDNDKMWSRLGTKNLVALARSAFANWESVKSTPNAKVFLAALLLHKHWNR